MPIAHISLRHCKPPLDHKFDFAWVSFRVNLRIMGQKNINPNYFNP